MLENFFPICCFETNPKFTYRHVAQLIVYIYEQHITHTFLCSIRLITILYYKLLNKVLNVTPKRRVSDI